MPIYVRVFNLLYTVISALPMEELGILAGVALCFAGGMYPVKEIPPLTFDSTRNELRRQYTTAAFEALRQCGGEQMLASMHDLSAQFNNAVAANALDDKKDDDGDGPASANRVLP